MTNMRWLAQITYATDNGVLAVDYAFDELDELHYLVERRPDWNAIEKIQIVLSPAYRQPVTVEEAREL